MKLTLQEEQKTLYFRYKLHFHIIPDWFWCTLIQVMMETQEIAKMLVQNHQKPSKKCKICLPVLELSTHTQKKFNGREILHRNCTECALSCITFSLTCKICPSIKIDTPIWGAWGVNSDLKFCPYMGPIYTFQNIPKGQFGPCERNVTSLIPRHNKQ